MAQGQRECTVPPSSGRRCPGAGRRWARPLCTGAAARPSGSSPCASGWPRGRPWRPGKARTHAKVPAVGLPGTLAPRGLVSGAIRARPSSAARRWAPALMMKVSSVQVSPARYSTAGTGPWLAWLAWGQVHREFHRQADGAGRMLVKALLSAKTGVSAEQFDGCGHECAHKVIAGRACFKRVLRSFVSQVPPNKRKALLF